MFPERLSTDLVSLNANVDRPAYTMEVRFDENGNQHGASINTVWKGITSIAARDVADVAKTFCGYGSLEITAAFSHADAGIAGMSAVTRLSLEFFSYRSYTGKIYVDEIDIR